MILLAKLAVLLVSYQDMSWRRTACRNNHRTRPICKVIVLQKYPVFRKFHTLHHTLTLPTGCVILWQSHLHSFQFSHKHHYYVCVQNFPTLFCISSILGLSNDFLFSIYIFYTLKGILLLLIHNTCSYYCVLNVINLFNVPTFRSCPQYIQKNYSEPLMEWN